MAPSTHLEVPPPPEVQEPKCIEPLAWEPREIKETPAAVVEQRPGLEEGTFRSSMIEYNRMKSSSRVLDTIISLLVNVAVLSGPVLAGLFFTDTINLKQLESTFLVAPPPPPPPPPAPAAVVVKAVPVRRVFEQSGRLIAPTAIPKSIAEIKEAPLPPDMDAGSGVPGGVPGGVAGGTMGGVIGGVIGGVTTAVPVAPVAPKENKPRAPVRVGGRVKEPRLVNRVEPVYPALARQTHMQGVVVIEAVLDEQGSVMEARVVSGPPLLIQSALDAVRRWKYEPTYLNDQPVAVQLNVTVTFRINE